MEFTNDIQDNAENMLRRSSENSSSGKVDEVANKNQNFAMFRGNRLAK